MFIQNLIRHFRFRMRRDVTLLIHKAAGLRPKWCNEKNLNLQSIHTIRGGKHVEKLGQENMCTFFFLMYAFKPSEHPPNKVKKTVKLVSIRWEHERVSKIG